MTEIVINNTTTRAIVLSEQPLPENNQIKVPGCTLSPGENDVDEKLWELSKKNAGIKMWIAEGYIRELPERSKPPLADDTNQVETVAMLKKIAKTENRMDLHEWGEKDDRPAIRKAVKERMAELKAEKPRPRGRPKKLVS
jgi:hypothetical protein